MLGFQTANISLTPRQHYKAREEVGQEAVSTCHLARPPWFPSWSLGTREEAGAWEPGETFDAGLIDWLAGTRHLGGCSFWKRQWRPARRRIANDKAMQIPVH